MKAHRLKVFIPSYIALSVVLVGLIIFAALGSFRSISAQSEFEHHVTDNLVNGVAELRYQAVQVQQYQTDSAATGEDDGLEDALKALNRAKEVLKNVTALDAGLQGDADTLSRQLDDLHQTGLRMVDAYRVSRTAGNAIMKGSDGFDLKTEAIVQQLERLSTRIEALQVAAVKAEATVLEESARLVLFLGMLLSLISLGVGMVLY